MPKSSDHKTSFIRSVTEDYIPDPKTVRLQKYSRNKENGDIIQAVILLAVILMMIVVVVVGMSKISETVSNKTNDNDVPEHNSFVTEDSLKEAVDNYFNKQQVSREEYSEYVAQLSEISQEMNVSNVFDEAEFKNLDEEKQAKLLTELEKILPTRILYDLTPYNTNAEKIGAYKKIHFNNIMWATQPYNMVKSISAVEDVTLFIEDEESVYDSFQINPESWEIASQNGETLDSKLFLKDMTFVVKDGALLLILQ